MRLISCNFCGIVMDTDRLEFDKEVFELKPEDELYNKCFAWDEKEQKISLTLNCPFCETRILLSNGDKADDS